MYKYRFHYLLRQLSYSDYQISWKFFPQALNISKSTWEKWIYIKIDDPREVNQEALKIIATFFECTVDQLINEKTPKRSLKKEFQNFKNAIQEL